MQIKANISALAFSIASLISSTANSNETIYRVPNNFYNFFGKEKTHEIIYRKVELEKPDFIFNYLDTVKSSESNQLKYMLAIDKSKQKAKLYSISDVMQKKISLVKEYNVSTGLNKGNKKKSGDNKTPEGMFGVTSIENSSDWLYDGKQAYGPLFFRLSYGSGIGLHGTNEPENLGKRASHGCIRFHDDDISELSKYLDTNSKVYIADKISNKVGYEIIVKPNRINPIKASLDYAQIIGMDKINYNKNIFSKIFKEKNLNTNHKLHMKLEDKLLQRQYIQTKTDDFKNISIYHERSKIGSDFINNIKGYIRQKNP